MQAGKFLAVIAAILTILGIFIFALVDVLLPGSTPSSGLGFLMNVPDLFGDFENLGTIFGLEDWFAIGLFVVMLIFVFSFILILLGYKSRIAVFFGALFPLAIGLVLLINGLSGNFPGAARFIANSSMNADLDSFPIFIDLGDGSGIGIYLLIAGGALGLISAALPREKYY